MKALSSIVSNLEKSELDRKLERVESDLLSGDVENPDADYQAWKDAEIREALEQSKDRSKMIPADKIWELFGQ